jgi:hypothetical protein
MYVNDDVLKWCAEYQGEKFHALLCDPPYNLSTITKRFGKEGAAVAKFGTDGAFQRASRGFMGKCYHPDTEVLTESGWKNIEYIVESHYSGGFYSLNPNTSEIEIVHAVDWQKYYFSGELLHLTGRSVDLLVTPNHKIWLQQGKEKYFCEADSLPSSFSMFNQGEWKGGACPDVLTFEHRSYLAAPFMRFLGLYLGDGCVVHRVNQPWKQDFISIAAKGETKKRNIAECCELLNLKYSQGDRQTFIYDKDLNDLLLPLGHAYDKYIFPWCFSLSKALLLQLWGGLLDTDGYSRSDGKCIQYFTTSRGLANDIQRLLLLCGRSATIGVRSPRGRKVLGVPLKSEMPSYVLSILAQDKKLWFEKVDHKSKKKRLLFEPFNGIVYDVELERNHILMVRRNGKTVWSSNSWDSEVAFYPETWKALGKHLYPGAFCMAFGGSRTFHRMAVAIEDAGFILHPTIGWVYGSGFPKATRIDNQIERGGSVPHQMATNALAEAWSSHRYGGQALKPSIEFVLVFQKPYVGRPIENMLASGAGGVNIDGGRIPHPNEIIGGRSTSGFTSERGIYSGDQEYELVGANYDVAGGRWPANFLLDADMVGMLDAQTGVLKSGKPVGLKHASNNVYGQYGTEIPITGYGDSGGPSRFFFQVENQIDEADPVKYCAKASRSERDAGLDGKKSPHPTVKPLSITKYLATLLLPPALYAPRRLLVPFAGVGSEMIGAFQAGWEEVVGIEGEAEYVSIGEKRISYWQGVKNV